MKTKPASAPSGDKNSALAVWLLGAGQTVMWAGLFYSFAALLLSWESDLGWKKTDIALGLTLAMLVAAAASPVTGRVVDAGKGRLLMGGGAIFGAAALALLATTQSQASFLALWALIGLAQASCLYDPCFALVTRTMGGSARAAITRITLCAGFASTIAFPAGAWLAATLGWRGAVLVFAACVAGLGAPLLFAGSTLLLRRGETAHVSPKRTENRAAVRTALGRREFWLLAIAFPMLALNHGILLNHIIPILIDRGLTETMAVTVASCIGPAQVAGRLLMMRFDHRFSAIAITVVAFAGHAAAAVVLFLADASAALAIVFCDNAGCGPRRDLYSEAGGNGRVAWPHRFRCHFRSAGHAQSCRLCDSALHRRGYRSTERLWRCDPGRRIHGPYRSGSHPMAVRHHAAIGHRLSGRRPTLD